MSMIEYALLWCWFLYNYILYTFSCFWFQFQFLYWMLSKFSCLTPQHSSQWEVMINMRLWQLFCCSYCSIMLDCTLLSVCFLLCPASWGISFWRWWIWEVSKFVTIILTIVHCILILIVSFYAQHISRFSFGDDEHEKPHFYRTMSPISFCNWGTLFAIWFTSIMDYGLFSFLHHSSYVGSSWGKMK